MAKRERRKRSKAARPARDRGERQQDPRLAATRATKVGEEQLPPNTWIVLVEPVTMDDGRELRWHPPQPVAFSLCEAKRLCDRAVPRRLRILGNLTARDDGSLGPQNDQTVLEVVSELWSAALHSFAAIEAIANDSIDRLPHDASVTIGKKDRIELVPRQAMARRLNLDEKLTLVIPMLDVGHAIKGTRPWERYLELKRLRGDLVHVKNRGYDPVPSVRTAYDQLLLGAADLCARDAFDIVQAVRPGYLDPHAVEHLRRQPK